MIDPRKAVRDYADKCIRCGICTGTDCGNYGNGEPNLGDICESILNGEPTWEYFPFTCALCNRCTVNCPVDLRAADASKPMRALLLEKKPELKPTYRKFRTDLKYNLFSTLKARNEGDIENITYIEGAADLGGEADHTAFFPGCALYAYAPEVTKRTFKWLRDEKIAAYTLYICCGATFFDVGFFDEFDVYRKRVVSYLEEHGIRRLIVVCSHCGHNLPVLLEGTDIELVRLPDVLVEHGVKAPCEETISFHDACYDRFGGAYGDAARALFDKATIKPMEHERRECLCCGGGGMVSMYAPDYCTYRRNQRLAEMDAVGADRVISTCFSCVNSLQRGIGSVPVQHYLEQIFDCEVNWSEVYGGVDALFADPKYEELCAREDLTLE